MPKNGATVAPVGGLVTAQSSDILAKSVLMWSLKIITLINDIGLDSALNHAGVSIDTPRKFKAAPAYLLSVFRKQDTPKLG